MGTRPCLAARQRTEASRFLHCDAVGWGGETKGASRYPDLLTSASPYVSPFGIW